MAFTARPTGSTLRRQDAFSEALHKPHAASERFDPDFPVMMRCEVCNEVGMARRGDVSAAMKEHRESHCKVLKAKQTDEFVQRIAYPWT